MEDLTEREKYSKAMFGTKDAFDVFGAILSFSVEPPQSFTIVDIHQEFLDRSSVTEGAIRRNVAKLEALEEIQRVPGESPAVHYQRTNSPFWDFIRDKTSMLIDHSLEA